MAIGVLAETAAANSGTVALSAALGGRGRSRFSDDPFGDKGPGSGPGIGIGLGLGSKGIENLLTNRYVDNADDNYDKKCTLFKYSERAEKCPKKAGEISTNAHHAIPDHCWRTGGVTQKIINQGLKGLGVGDTVTGKLAELFGQIGSQALDEKLPGGAYYDERMDKQKGLAICVTGQGKTLQHGAIHKEMDRLENQLGLKGNPKYTATLGDMEDAAAKSISKATGCSETDLKDQLRKYHKGLGFENPDKMLLRADSTGRNTAAWGKDPIINSGTGGSNF